jgi:hypothetical protein
MNRLFLASLLCFPLSAIAASAHLDVIKMELQEGCSLADLMEITNDFNEWGADHGYHARIAVALQNDDANAMYWLGESANAATFGAAWDTWRDAQADPESVPAQLSARFAECSNNVSRSGYDLY